MIVSAQPLKNIADIGKIVTATRNTAGTCYRHVERVFNPERKETHWGKAKAEERPMTAFVDVDTSKQVGDPDHVALCATPG